MTDRKHARPVVRELVDLVAFRASYGRPCYLKRNTAYAALIVPYLTAGPGGPYSYLRTFRRATVDEAVRLGFVRLGWKRVDVPEFAIAGNHWSAEPAHQGRTIVLRETGGEPQ